ncbi:hypothetical protein BKA82DRAFT_1007396 [Pisolithus tinctorius]|uniref:Uncharacterized protein n=1 Tax=Pisolithus tinctorius Marx 270 TaxID=870435 RepID=A0A0C3JCW6_PISTI|nr:hypothetical protein BKA82DRAFT_1007396 [Pisolithus tinctorius]KIN95526.1 hypothetical protein M404DRAFT_1007396 [Pisolithus tinctorius Marx 270]
MKAGMLDSKVANTYSRRSMLTEGKREGLSEKASWSSLTRIAKDGVYVSKVLTRRMYTAMSHQSFQSRLRDGTLRTLGIWGASTNEEIAVMPRRTSRRYSAPPQHRWRDLCHHQGL